MIYGIVENGGDGINGGIGGLMDDAYLRHVTFYISVTYPAETLEKFESLGGKTVMLPAETLEAPPVGDTRA